MTPLEPFGCAEDYLELGMPSEANGALEELLQHFHLTEHWMRLREKALLGIGDAVGAETIRALLAGLPDAP